MTNLTTYIFLISSLASLAKQFDGTLITHDGYEYYVNVEILKGLLENEPNIDLATKVLSTIMHSMTRQDNINLITNDGYLVGALIWDEEYGRYDQLK